MVRGDFSGNEAFEQRPQGSEDEPFGNLGEEDARQRAKEEQRAWGAGGEAPAKQAPIPLAVGSVGDPSSGSVSQTCPRLSAALLKVTPSSGAATSNELGDEGRAVSTPCLNSGQDQRGAGNGGNGPLPHPPGRGEGEVRKALTLRFA